MTQQPNVIDIKSVIIEHLKSLHNLFNSIRQAEKDTLYSDTKKLKTF